MTANRLLRWLGGGVVKGPVTTALVALEGIDDPEHIAALLYWFGIKGRRGDKFSCPLANYLWRASGHRVIVTGGEVMGETNEGVRIHPGVGWSPRSIELSPVLADFTEQFDDGAYPFLAEGEPDD